MNDLVFTSVAFGERYLAQQTRLKESILKIYPDANLHFFYDCLPKASRSFYDSLYGFKPHAIQECIDLGFKRVIFLDPAMILVDKIDDLYEFDVMAVMDDNLLYNAISDRCRTQFLLTNDGIKKAGWHFVGGSIYYFDFRSELAQTVFDTWMFCEKKGLFGSQEEEASGRLQGHRLDEACMAVSMYLHGVEPTRMEVARYCTEKNPMWIKKHFK